MRHLALVPLLASAFALAADPPKPTAPPAPAQAAASAKPADVDSIDHLIAALYDVISGPAKHPRDWARFRGLFHESGRLTAAGKRPSGEIATRVMDVNGYVERSDPFFQKEGFFEREIARRTERFGHVAHVLSTYESRRDPGAEPFARGVNSIQLLNDGTRWWILSVFWEAETPESRLPEKYLRTPAE